MKCIIGSDHAGFELKETVKSFLRERGCSVEDVGPESSGPVDYPDFGRIVAVGVSSGRYDRGILLCGSGVGMSIVANKFPGVRAVLALDEETALMSRLHNDTNILALAGRRTGPDQARAILSVWLDTPFEGGRHQKRLDKIAKIEKDLYNLR